MMNRSSMLLSALVLFMPWSASAQAEPDFEDMAAAMERAKAFTQPSRHHEVLGRLIGKWNVETRIIGMSGAPEMPGAAEFRWLMEGRWVTSDLTGTMMGMPFAATTLMGYDNFKQSYRVCSVSSIDTAMLVSEGDLTPDGKALIAYGTLDEYLTGEHDKMVKYVWRFESSDRFVLEVHDLPIGEVNTKVVEQTFTRQ